MRFFLLGLTVALPFLACVALFLFKSRKEPLALLLARAAGWCTLCIAPAILVQDVMQLAASQFQWITCARILPFQIWVLAGGAAVQAVFEETAKDISGHRQSTMIDNWPIYAGYTLAWILFWGAVIAVRLRGDVHLRKDPVAWFVGLVLLGNALAGVGWPWWGT